MEICSKERLWGYGSGGVGGGGGEFGLCTLDYTVMRKECELMFKQMLNNNSITVLQVMLKISTIRIELNTVDVLPL